MNVAKEDITENVSEEDIENDSTGNDEPPKINKVAFRKAHNSIPDDSKLRRSPRKKKRVSYTEVDEGGGISRTPEPRTPPQAPRDLSPLMNTSNKRPLEKE